MTENIANGEDGIMAAWFNSPSTFIVWRSTTPVSDIANSINWANLTPENPVTGAGQDAVNWLSACQGKVLNLQTLLGGGVSVATGKANIRAGLQDATSNIPSGIGGATKGGGWANIMASIQRPATNAEKALATGTGTALSPGNLTFEGRIQVNEVITIMGR